MNFTEEEWDKVREVFVQKTSDINKCESKDFYWASLQLENYKVFNINNRKIITISTNWFTDILKDDLYTASQKFSSEFGKQNTESILKALFEICPYFDYNSYDDFLVNEQFLFAIEISNSKIIDKFLRLDLYRINDTTAFTGGIFHVLKHFNSNGLNLSTEKGETPIMKPYAIIKLILNGFFNEELIKSEKPNEYYSYTNYNDSKKLKFVFYYDKCKDVYYIITCHIEK
jgi:hypothetical protein